MRFWLRYVLRHPYLKVFSYVHHQMAVSADLHTVVYAESPSCFGEVQASVESLERSARLLEGHGLGVSHRLTSVMLALHKPGLGSLEGNAFWEQMMDFAANHVLRELNNLLMRQPDYDSDPGKLPT